MKHIILYTNISQGCRKLLKVGGGPMVNWQMAKLGGQMLGQIGAKIWIFQTELGPIPVTIIKM